MFRETSPKHTKIKKSITFLFVASWVPLKVMQNKSKYYGTNSC